MMYGNSSNGYGYSPRNYAVSNPTNSNSQFLNASGSRQGGYYYSCTSKQSNSGKWKQSGSGAWYKD